MDSITRNFYKLGTDIKPIKISRLGKPNNKSRQLKIELLVVLEVFKILGLSRNLNLIKILKILDSRVMFEYQKVSQI
ncbi:Uncharacterized protein FWK35_00002656 [Aphis craccivora]|uniref:Uncharacterized protein n=1 Tax=Aphis craccivora TaxID=307492 RepID=A0A6G0ZAU3_APHCR|nr:Uncharacterized protein FWK35_00002656 [Aphis craccivora]